MKKVLIILLVFCSSFIFGQSKVGSTAAPFLTVSVGPRAIAMGSAFVGTSNDITALYWNPAGIARIPGNSAVFNVTNWIADIDYNWAAATINLGGAGTFGISVSSLDYGEMEITTLSEPDGTGGSFGAEDLAIGLSYAYNLTDRFSLGGTVKYIQQTIWNSKATSVAVDVGVLFTSDLAGLRIGASITNFGSTMNMTGSDLFVQHDVDPNIFGNNDQILAELRTDEWPLPLTFRIGLAIDAFNIENHRVTIGADAIHPNDNDESLNVGAEYEFYNILSLRAGYKSLFLDNSEEGLTLGFGLKYDFAPGFGLFFDYAYQDVGVLDDTQHFSFGVNF